MPFPFELPTTSSVCFTDFYSSSTHPSLPLAATTSRGVLRDVLKKYKRLPPTSQTSNLPAVQSALNDYLLYLSALDAGLRIVPSPSSPATGAEEIDVIPLKELAVEWRATLTATLPGRDPPRLRVQGLEPELAFVLSTLAYVHSLQARAQLHALHNSAAASPSPEQRAAAISGAMRSFLEAHAIHAYLVQRAGSGSGSSGHAQPAGDEGQPKAAMRRLPGLPSSASASAASSVPPDVTAGVQTALAELTLAEATLIAVLKDDPYPAVVAEDRNRASKDWMFKAPDIPKVRAHLFARLCLAAAEHAARGLAGLGSSSAGKVDEALARYLEDLRRTARGKACRFFGIDAELAGKTGEGIAWLRAAKKELGFLTASAAEEESRKRGFASRLKKDWAEKREDRKIEKGIDWGSDAGRFEEGRVVEMLEKKWVKMNDTVGVQTIPPLEPLLASMPSGREYHSPKPYKLPALDDSILIRMRAPPDPADSVFAGNEDDSGDDDERLAHAADPVGAFPGTSDDYAGDRNYY
ncbi:pH-response regulator protein palC [Macrophomina phaseolina]|uniref:pH-response regulator protein palC n=1 Tax=Macrophomina phaseolina TaxID=35725 RepID=A0ABQ8GTE7_9PEZI|nr:pH-response regulator protein palC [Macrophomina phaseolina]